MHFVTPHAVHAGAKRTVYAADQPPYSPLPCAVDEDGLVLTELELTEEDLEILAEGGRVRIWVRTFGKPLQPLAVEAVPAPVTDPSQVSLENAEILVDQDTVIVNGRLLRPLDMGEEDQYPAGEVVLHEGILYKDEGAVQ